MMVGGDKEPHGAAQGFQRAAETATPTCQPLERGAPIGIETLNGLRLFLANGDDLLAAFGPDQFAIGRMPSTAIALGVGERINEGLQGSDAAILADLLPDDQAGPTVDGGDAIDCVFFSLTEV